MSTINEIMAKDPHEYSKTDLEAVIAEMRKGRSQFAATGTTKKAPTKENLGALKLDLNKLRPGK